MLDDSDAALDYCYLVTTGRTSGLPREIEIWFGLSGTTLYLLAGGGEKAHWVRNIRLRPSVSLRLGERTHDAIARVVEPGTDEDALARRLLLEKYQPGYAGDLSGWGGTALSIALDLEDPASR